MRILGVDPGTYVVGYGCVEVRGSDLRLKDQGILKAPRGMPLKDRLLLLGKGLAEVLRRTAPDTLAVESAFYGRNIASALRIGESRGVAIFVAAEAGIDVAEYAPAAVKKAVTGNGNAAKEQVAAMVARILGSGLDPLAEDAADALAVAICHAHRTGPAARLR